MHVNLMSDTQTKPTAAMRAVMATADVGDEQMGTDPTVNRLLERVAALLGKEAALFLPNGTMCNQVAIKAHTRPGDVVVSDIMAHIIRAETGGPAFNSGVMVEAIMCANGIFTPADLDAAVARIQQVPHPYAPIPRMLCVEQTHNFGGGAVWQLDELRAVTDRAREHGLATHMDGARLLNAVVASGVDAATYSACVDTAWIDFTKGLGAPLGAVLAGSREFIAHARTYKHMFGGSLRQAGIVAAGCIHALDHHIERLADDHARARTLAEGLAALPGITVRTTAPATNMVFFRVDGSGLDKATFLGQMGAADVLMGGVGDEIRAVTHLDIDDAAIAYTLDVAAQVVAQAAPAA